jgi:hypothetical protein
VEVLWSHILPALWKEYRHSGGLAIPCRSRVASSLILTLVVIHVIHALVKQWGILGLRMDREKVDAAQDLKEH